MSDVKAATPAQDVQKVEEKKLDPLGPAQMHEAEYKRTIYIANVPKGVRPEDLVKPGYWAHVAAKLKPWDRIECRAEDGTWYCELMVLEASRAFARMCPLQTAFLTTADVAQSQTEPVGFEVLHRGPRKWSVVRTTDRAVMSEEHETKGGADAWLKTNFEALKTGAVSPVK